MKKLYPIPAGNGHRLLTLEEIKSEARMMLAHVTKEPFEAEETAFNFCESLALLTQPSSEKNAVNAAVLIGLAFLLTVSVSPSPP